MTELEHILSRIAGVGGKVDHVIMNPATVVTYIKVVKHRRRRLHRFRRRARIRRRGW